MFETICHTISDGDDGDDGDNGTFIDFTDASNNEIIAGVHIIANNNITELNSSLGK